MIRGWTELVPDEEVDVRRQVYRYRFSPDIGLDRAEEILVMAVYAAEGVHGAARVRLEAGYLLDRKARTCVLEASTAVGETVARVFTNYLSREFGEDSFEIEVLNPDVPGGPADGTKPAEATR